MVSVCLFCVCLSVGRPVSSGSQLVGYTVGGAAVREMGCFVGLRARLLAGWEGRVSVPVFGLASHGGLGELWDARGRSSGHARVWSLHEKMRTLRARCIGLSISW